MIFVTRGIATFGPLSPHLFYQWLKPDTEPLVIQICKVWRHAPPVHWGRRTHGLEPAQPTDGADVALRQQAAQVVGALTCQKTDVFECVASYAAVRAERGQGAGATDTRRHQSYFVTYGYARALPARTSGQSIHHNV